MKRFLMLACLTFLPGSGRSESLEDLREQVRKTEIAFAQSTANREHNAFVSFLAEDAVFMGGKQVFRGKREIAEGWKRFYEGGEAPFSWEPARVEAVPSGTLALSTGPVLDSSGKRIGTFTSVWRREADGRWKIVLDGGCPPCPCSPESDATKPVTGS